MVFFCNLETLRRRFHALINPAAALGRINVVDFDPNGAGVDGAGFTSVVVVDLQFRSGARTQKTEGIEIAFEVSPVAKGIKDAFALGVDAVGCSFDHGGSAGSLRFRNGHKEFVTRITDAGRHAGDSVAGTSRVLRGAREL